MFPFVGCSGMRREQPNILFILTDQQHGFTINENEGIRTRKWDSCAFAGFTKMAGGDNPRSEKKDRLKRRFFHKLSYQYILKNKVHGCVGCGRCVTTCFANISMPDIVEKIRRGEAD